MKRNRMVLFTMVMAALSLFSAASAKDVVWPIVEEQVFEPIDYADAENWAYDGENAENPVDLFLVAPSVYFGSETELMMPLTEDTKYKTHGALQMERGIYDQSCRLFAPYYRQAALSVYNLSEEEGAPYFAKAYQDVREAYRYYMENLNEGRPYILAGFSQGADLALRLAKEFFADSTCTENLVAVYANGWNLPKAELARYPYLKPAQSEDDLGVIVIINTESDDITSSVIVPTDTIGINPLNWRTDGTPADASLNKGACFTNYDAEIVKEIPNFCGCRLDEKRGTLKISGIQKEDYPAGIPFLQEGVYHIYDYQFFFRNLQENVRVRAERFLELQDQPAAAQ